MKRALAVVVVALLVFAFAEVFFKLIKISWND
jgi:hypothetical protein